MKQKRSIINVYTFNIERGQIDDKVDGRSNSKMYYRKSYVRV